MAKTGNTTDKKSLETTDTKNGKCLSDLFEEGLKDIYNAEKQLVEVLPEVATAAYSEELQDTINNHLEQTKRHVQRLEKVFTQLNIDKNDEEKCEAMEGLIKEVKQVISEFDQSPVRDSALIIGSQKIEHYEIASYGSLCELSDVLGYTGICDILDRTLEEEKTADEMLSDIAMDVNDEAYELSEQQ